MKKTSRTGVVKEFSNNTGYGKIQDTETGLELEFNYLDCLIDYPEQGDNVTFEVLSYETYPDHAHCVEKVATK